MKTLMRFWSSYPLNDFATRWAVVGACAIVVAVWLSVLRVTVEAGPIMPKLQFGGIMLFFGILYAHAESRMPKLRMPLAVVADLCLSVMQVLLVTTVLLPLTYLAATTGFPLLDGRLTQLDATIGFDWDTAARWVANRPVIDRVLQIGYNSMPYQVALVLLIGSLKRPGDRNGETVWLTIVSLLITCAIFAFTPAVGKIGHVGTGYLNVLTEIRDGTWSVLNYHRAEGIVTFPSFHTTAAVLLTYVVRHDRWVFAGLLPLNMLMVVSTPTVGGHYLVDLFGGTAVAVISILIVNAVRHRTLARHPRFIPRKGLFEATCPLDLGAAGR